jgi:hypothetical protein
MNLLQHTMVKISIAADFRKNNSIFAAAISAA